MMCEGAKCPRVECMILQRDDKLLCFVSLKPATSDIYLAILKLNCSKMAIVIIVLSIHALQS